MTILPLTGRSVEAQAGHMTTSPRFRDRILARVLGASLDRELAAGRPAEARPALAARARRLVSPAARRQLIQGWNNVLRQARRPDFMPRPPLARDQVIAAEPDVRYLLARLAGPRPVAARGAATAMVLLTDGTGPVHNPRSALSLTAAVREAIRQLDPLAGSGRSPAPQTGPALRDRRAPGQVPAPGPASRGPGC
jgi:hypothetical protein